MTQEQIYIVSKLNEVYQEIIVRSLYYKTFLEVLCRYENLEI